MAEIDSYYLNKEEPNKSCLLALRDIILRHDKEFIETQKYGMPCFCYRKRILCYLWIDRKLNQPYILMAEGKLIDHPQLEKGERSKMKILRVDPNKDLPIKTIKVILKSSLDLLRTKVKLK